MRAKSWSRRISDPPITMAGLLPLTLKTTDTWDLLVKQGLIMISAVQTRFYKYAVLALLYLGWCISYIDRAAITLLICSQN